jgi:hypothetical protein
MSRSLQTVSYQSQQSRAALVWLKRHVGDSVNTPLTHTHPTFTPTPPPPTLIHAPIHPQMPPTLPHTPCAPTPTRKHGEPDSVSLSLRGKSPKVTSEPPSLPQRSAVSVYWTPALLLEAALLRGHEAAGEDQEALSALWQSTVHTCSPSRPPRLLWNLRPWLLASSNVGWVWCVTLQPLSPRRPFSIPLPFCGAGDSDVLLPPQALCSLTPHPAGSGRQEEKRGRDCHSNCACDHLSGQAECSPHLWMDRQMC